MPRLDPPVATRFSSTLQPSKHGPAKGTKYFKPMLRKILESNIEYEDPILNKKVKGKIGRVISLRHVMNAIQGEHNAIKDIMDRADDENVPQSTVNLQTNITNIKYEWNENIQDSVHPPVIPVGDSQSSGEIQGG